MFKILLIYFILLVSSLVILAQDLAPDDACSEVSCGHGYCRVINEVAELPSPFAFASNLTFSICICEQPYVDGLDGKPCSYRGKSRLVTFLLSLFVCARLEL